MTVDISQRALAKHGMRKGAYDGARKRRFVLFTSNNAGTECRREFDTKAERDAKAWHLILNPPQASVESLPLFSRVKE